MNGTGEGPSSDLDLSGRTALVCASTSGLGEAIARGLAARGARVVVSGRRLERARAIADELPGAIALESDLSRVGEAGSLFERATRAIGTIDVLVLNGPGPAPATATDVSGTALTAALDTLFLAQVELAQLATAGMRERGWGRVVAVGSSGIEIPIPGLAASNAARAALAGYLKTLAGEVAAYGVTVNLVLPGRIATDRVASLDAARADRTGSTPAEVKAASVASIPAKRYGTPEEFAAPVVFLASPAASYITGTALRCDGGLVPTL